MKRYLITYLFSFLCAFILAFLAMWAFQGRFAGSARELVTTGVVLVMASLAALF